MRVLQGDFREGDAVRIDASGGGLQFSRSGRASLSDCGPDPARPGRAGPDPRRTRRTIRAMADQTPGSRPTRARGARPTGSWRPRRLPGSTMWYVARVPAAAGARTGCSSRPSRRARRSPTATSSKAIREGQVIELTLGDDRIRGTLKNEGGKPRTFTTVRVEDPKLVEDLEATASSSPASSPAAGSARSWAGSFRSSSSSRSGASSSGGWAAPKAA